MYRSPQCMICGNLVFFWSIMGMPNYYLTTKKKSSKKNKNTPKIPPPPKKKTCMLIFMVSNCIFHCLHEKLFNSIHARSTSDFVIL